MTNDLFIDGHNVTGELRERIEAMETRIASLETRREVPLIITFLVTLVIGVIMGNML